MASTSFWRCDVDLNALYHAQEIDRSRYYGVALKQFSRAPNSDLKVAAANAVWEVEIEERFTHFKKELKRLGYKKLFVGAHPKWPVSAAGNMVFAEPPTSINGRVALWQGVCDLLGGQSCGSGHEHYDQAQLSLPPPAFARFVGVHDL